MPGRSAPLLAFVLPSVLALVLGGVYLGVRRLTASPQTDPAHLVRACDLLSPRDVRHLAGPGFRQHEQDLRQESDHDVLATGCAYRTLTERIEDSRTLELDVRAARTPVGERRNQEQFLQSWKGTRPVPGIGDQAFWIINPGVLFVLAGGNWYTLSVGPTDGRRPHSEQEAIAVANALSARL